MSAMGSVMVMNDPLLSPAGLGHARHLAGMHELAQTDTAEPELAVDRTRAAAAAAPCVAAHFELGLGLLLLYQCLLGHGSALLPFTSEREPEGVEQRPAFGIGAAGRHNRDVHASGGVDLVVVDLGEDQLLGDAEGVVAPAVER